MDKKSKILIWIVVILIIGSVGATYWRIFVKQDYVISNEVDCDPYEEACFIWECVPGSLEEWEQCTGDPEMDVWYYKLVERKAANIPLCDPEEDEDCAPFVCEEDEEDCTEYLCEEGNADEIECTDPVQFAIDNPYEEEEECAEDDEECLMGDEEEIICEEGDEECVAAEEEMECEEGDEACLVEEVEGEEEMVEDETAVDEIINETTDDVENSLE